jgi:hypothetical protein
MCFRILTSGLTLSVLFLLAGQVKGQPGGGGPPDPGELTPAISGMAMLAGSTDHSGIEVEFSRTAPAPLVQVFITDAAGNYSGPLPVGLYDITYRRNGYFSNYVPNVNCFTPPTLAVQILHLRSTRIHVPEFFPLIQHAIDNANPGDTIILAPGIYEENIDIKGKRITLTSQFIFSKDTSHITSTIIDGKNEKTVIALDTYVDSRTHITGLTIRNGRATGESPHDMGGGIRCNVSSPTLTHLVIENCYADYGGGGIYLHLSQSQIAFVKITGNSARVDGGGIRITSSDVTVSNAIINNNSAGERGGGIACTHFNYVGTAEIINSTLVNNSVTMTSGPNSQFSGGAAIKAYGHNLIVKNSIVASNRNDHAISYYNTSGSNAYPFISYSLFWDNQPGDFYDCNPLNGPAITENINGTPVDAFFNVFGNPDFKGGTDYSLHSTSPAVDAGYNEFAEVETDIYLNSRIQNNNNLTEAIVNIGATETVAGIKPVVSFDDAICITESESAAITISSTGQEFAWFTSANGEGYLGTSGNELSLDTLTRSVTLYVANADYLLLSDLTPVSINVYAVPDFSIEMTPVNALSYQFSAGSAQHITGFAWTVSNSAQTSDEASPIFEFSETGSFEVCLQASNPACQSMQCETFELVITDIHPEMQAASFEVFPNPATNNVTIQSKQGEAFSFELVNAAGSKIDSRQNGSSYEVDIAHVERGIYFLIIKPEALKAKTRIYKIIKTK